MSKLRKIANSEMGKLPNLFSFSNGKISLTEEVIDFLKNNFLQTKRNVAIDENSGIIIAHFVMDRAGLEDKFSATVDDATCKIIVKKLEQDFKDSIKEKLRETDLSFSDVVELEFEYGDGVFHTIVTLHGE